MRAYTLVPYLCLLVNVFSATWLPPSGWDLMQNRMGAANVPVTCMNRSAWLSPPARDGGKVLGVDKIYIIHYSRASYRHALMTTQLARVGVDAGAPVVEFVRVYDREEFAKGQADVLFVASCSGCGFRIPGQAYSTALCSTNLKHAAAWMDIFRRGYESALLLEDDMDLCGSNSSGTFRDEMLALMDDLKGHVFDTVMLGNCGLREGGIGETRVSAHIVRPPAKLGASRCAGAYVVSNRGARRLLAGLPFKRIRAPDHHINHVGALVGSAFVGLWASPPLAKDMKLRKSQRHSWRVAD